MEEAREEDTECLNKEYVAKRWVEDFGCIMTYKSS